MIAHDVVMGELERMGAAGDMSRYGEAHARLHGDTSRMTGARPMPREITDEERRDFEAKRWFRLNYLQHIGVISK